MDSTITISERGEERIRNGHFWIYRADVVGGEAWAGEVVRVVNVRRRFIAKAMYSAKTANATMLAAP